MTINNIKDLLVLHEGVRKFPYLDTKGITTIGVGFNLSTVGLYPEEIDFMLTFRLGKAKEDLERIFPYINELDEVRQAVLLDMCYNLGANALAQFKQTLASVQDGNYELASEQMLQSLLAGQTGTRAKRLSEMMKTGEWPKW